jgi:signal transduction histidine kinase
VLGAGNPYLPFAILYLLDEDRTFASLVAKTGLDDAFAPTALRLNLGDAWGVAQVIREGEVIRLNDLARRFGTLPGGVWPEPTISAIVLPVAKPGQKAGTAGALVAGINPRRALDDAYRGFFDLVAGHLAMAVSNARAYEEERKRDEALAEVDRAKTQFFSNVSHEFRTPLTLMLGPLEEMLAKPQTNPLSDDRSLVRFAHRNGVRLLKLVNTLLDFSRIEAGRVQASFQPIELAVFMAELASNFRSAIERAGLRLVIDCPSLPHQVYVDAGMWEKVMLNLISNAFKFTFEGEIGIAAKPSSDGRYVEVTVRDTGTGIPRRGEPHVSLRPESARSGMTGPSLNPSEMKPSMECVKLYARVASQPNFALHTKGDSMDSTNDNADLRGTVSGERNQSDQPMHLADRVLGAQRHICAFFHNRDEEYRVLLPFIKEGLDRGEKAFHIIDPRLREEHLERLRSAGIDVAATELSGRLELRNWEEAFLQGGYCGKDRMIAMVQEIVERGRQQGFPLTRLVGHAE